MYNRGFSIRKTLEVYPYLNKYWIIMHYTSLVDKVKILFLIMAITDQIHR